NRAEKPSDRRLRAFSRRLCLERLEERSLLATSGGRGAFLSPPLIELVRSPGERWGAAAAESDTLSLLSFPGAEGAVGGEAPGAAARGGAGADRGSLPVVPASPEYTLRDHTDTEEGPDSAVLGTGRGSGDAAPLPSAMTADRESWVPPPALDVGAPLPQA